MGRDKIRDTYLNKALEILIDCDIPARALLLLAVGLEAEFIPNRELIVNKLTEYSKSYTGMPSVCKIIVMYLIGI